MKKNELAQFMSDACALVNEKLPPPTSGAKRAQHLGILFAILALAEGRQQVSVKALTQMVGMPQPAINTILNSLLAMGILQRETAIPNKGKSMYLYSPVLRNAVN